MEIEYTLQAKEDLSFWKKSNNVAVLKKIRKAILKGLTKASASQNH
jgi:Txe/YoeB family toxin of Txe-Axe toxin-antitoxin module